MVAREVSVHQAPTMSHHLRHTPLGARLARGVDQGRHSAPQHVVLAQVAGSSRGALARLAADVGGEVCYVERSEDAAVPLYEYTWNHTTLHALKRDKAVTYLQAAMMPGRATELVGEVEDHFGAHEVVQHLEVVRFGGRVGFASLALLLPHGADKAARLTRLGEIMRWHEAAGIHVFSPHTHVLEDGGMKETDWAALGFKAGADPAGVLNPGKMRAWEENQATTEVSDPKGSFSAAYRLALAVAPGAASGGAAPGGSTAPPGAPHSGGGGSSEPAPPPAPRSRLWAEWTTADFATADLTDAVAVLPLGAVEAHGPHLPLGVDAMHNSALLAAALARLPSHVTALALPPLDIGASCEHIGFAGTVGLKPETAAAVWAEVGACVARAGIRKIILYNSHGGNHAVAEVVARRLRVEHHMVAVLALNLGMDGSCAESLFPGDELRWGIHGGGLETSVMLHLRPELVDMTQARRFESSAAAMPADGLLQKHSLGFGVKAGWVSHDLNPAGVRRCSLNR